VAEGGLEPVSRIRDILIRIQIRGSEPLNNDPDPARFVSDLQDAMQQVFLVITFTSYFKDKKSKEQKSMFFLLFLLDDGRIRIRTSD
jgi:hypothetical protein